MPGTGNTSTEEPGASARGLIPTSRTCAARESPAHRRSHHQAVGKAYLTTEYPRDQARHGMLLVQLHGARAGEPWAPAGARRMLARAGERAGLGRIRPHAFRHTPSRPRFLMPPAVTC